MTALVLLAVLLDRPSLSFRLVAVAAVVVLLLAPESLLSPSFQMSFAAAMALIATYETLRRGLTRWASNQTIAMRPTLYLGGVLLTTLVAGLATGPYAMFHFNRIADYGLLANLLAVPITGLWVMPFGLLALALLPIGLEELALVPMGLGIDTVLWISEKVAALPGAVTLVPATSGPVLGLITVGLLWLCIWRRRWRFFGIVLIAVGLTFVVFTRGPDILIEEEARLMAARDASGTLWLSSRQRARFTGQSWLRMGGQESSNAWPHRDGLAESGMRCDTLGCRQRIRGQWVAFVLDARALPEDCASADVVISVVPIRGGCPSAHTVVDRFDVWRDGGVAIWLEPDGARIANVRETRGNRPWSRPPNK
jgi:competence protein ComEC